MNTKKDEIIETLKSKIDQFELERIDLLMDSKKLERLYDQGIIDSEGHPLPFNINDEDAMK